MRNDSLFWGMRWRGRRGSANGKMGNRIVKRPIIFPLARTYARTLTGVFTFLLSQVSQDYLKGIV